MRVEEEVIKEDLKDWAKIVSLYQKPSKVKATIQIVNSFLPFLGLWVLMYLSLSYSYWLTLLLGIVNGFFLVRIFIIQHDCGHYSFFKSRRSCHALGWICGFFSTIPFRYWARTHSYHHSHVGQLEHRDVGDIDFLTVKEFRERSKWGRLRYRIFRHPFILFGIAPVYYMIIGCRIPVINVRSIRNMTLSQQLHNLVLISLYLLLGYFLGWGKFFAVQASIIVIFSIIAFWFFYVQHQHEHTYMQWKNNWDYLVASIKGSTFYKLPRVFRWLTGNIGYHHIHHLNSRIPNYNLVKCEEDNPILTKHVTTIGFWQSLKLMMNKLWDEDSQRMITFRQFYQQEKLRNAA